MLGSIENFLPSEHWREFERFALKIVEIKVRNNIVYNDILTWRTQDTRDQGIDGHVLVTAAGGELHITVEAKLRKGGSLSLKDIASSILNYLVNFSDVHFVVTNIRFTEDAYRILDAINMDTRFCLNYLDCYVLCSYMDEHPELETMFPALAQNIRAEAAKTEPLPHKSGKNNCKLPKVPYPSSRKEALEQLIRYINEAVPLIALIGSRGTDKSLLIDLCIRRLCYDTPLLRIDMQYVGSVRAFLLAVLKNLLGLDIFECLSLLSEQEGEEVWQTSNSGGEHNGRVVDTLRKILRIRSSDSEPSIENYLIQEFLHELTSTNHLRRVLFLENLNAVTPEMVTEIMNLLPRIADCNISIVLELSYEIPVGNRTLRYPEWYSCIEQIGAMRIAARSTERVILYEYSEAEAAAVFSELTGQEENGYFVQQAIQKYGRNPGILREIASILTARNITTATELYSIPVPGSAEVFQFSLFAALQDAQALGIKNLQAVRWCLKAADLLHGCISRALAAAIEAHFFAVGTERSIDASRLFQKSDSHFSIRNESAKEILHAATMYWDAQELISFLLANQSLWGLSEVIQECMEADMLFACRDSRALDSADAAVRICKRHREHHLEASLLKKCRDFTRFSATSEKRRQHLQYALHTLEKEHELALTKMEQQEAEGDALMEQCLALFQECPSKNTATLLICCYLQQNRLRRSRFHFAQGEAFIDACFQPAKEFGLNGLGVQVYVAKALCVKEQGSVERCFQIFRDGISAYPRDPFLRSCYLANYAATLSKRDIPAAIRCCKAALTAAQQTGDTELCCWLKEDMMVYRLISREHNDDLLQDIQACRKVADMYCFRPDISRTYNIEGVFLAIHREFQRSIQCFRNALLCFDPAIVDQQKFLFRCNLLMLLEPASSESFELFQQLLLWLKQNSSWLLEKLQQRAVLSAESNFAALVSLLASARRLKNQDAFACILRLFPLAPLVNLRYNRRIHFEELLASKFLLAPGKVLILF